MMNQKITVVMKTVVKVTYPWKLSPAELVPDEDEAREVHLDVQLVTWLRAKL